jgi:hypothetical protein
MSRLADIRAALVARIGSVPQVGVVHDRERYLKNEAAFRSLYVASGVSPQLRGWWLRRAATERRALNMSRRLVIHTWHVRGYMALADDAGTELVFDELIESIAAALDSDPTLGGLTDPAPLNQQDSREGLQVTDCGPVMFCGVLCHSAVLELRTWNYE